MVRVLINATRYRRGGRNYDSVQTDSLSFIPLVTSALPTATRLSEASRPRQAHPIQHHSVSGAEERAPLSNSASGGRGKASSRRRVARSPARGRIRGKGCFPVFSKAFPPRGHLKANFNIQARA